MRQLDGAFGVATLATVFATAGGYTSAAAFDVVTEVPILS
jgi:hypothetical protein